MTAMMLTDRHVDPTLTYDIGVDIDDVLYPWYVTAHALCEQAGITNGVQPKTWRMADEYGCDVEVWASVLDKATEDGKMYGADPIPGSIEALRRLMFAGHRIHLVTARGMGAWQTTDQRLEIHRQTFDWLQEFAVPRDSVIFEADKTYEANRLGLDFFIDDAVHNFEALSLGTQGCEAYLMTAPHNVDYWTPFRLETMDEFADLIIEAGEREARKLQ